MNESESRRPFRIPSELREEDRPRWRVKTEDGQIRGPLSDHGLRSLAEVGILTERAQLRTNESEKFVPIHSHPIWAQVKVRRTEWMLKSSLSLRESRPPVGAPLPPGGTTVPFPARATSTAPFAHAPSAKFVPDRENVLTGPSDAGGPAYWAVRADYPSAQDGSRAVSSRARTQRAKMEALHIAKTAKIFAALRIAGAFRVLRELFILTLFLALGDLFRRGFVDALGAARWLAVFCVALLAMAYYLFSVFQD